MAYDIDDEIRVIRKGQAIAAQYPMPPGVVGYDPSYRTHLALRSGAAKALLDMFGYVTRWRRLRDARRQAHWSCTTSRRHERDRQLAELWVKSLRRASASAWRRSRTSSPTC